MKYFYHLVLFLTISAVFLFAYAQSSPDSGVYIDSSGVMRWNSSNKEVSLFGVNYTTPFAYSFRAQKKLGLSLKKAIDIDVEQFARLGLDAFRVHVWDREISDKEGNILNNEHLDLFDYLVSKLAEKHIKIILTPIAWWGTGWPEPDPKAPGFSQYYSKIQLVTNKEARAAERNYLKQFVNHLNPYRKFSYKDDPDIIAMEIINEPAHPEDGKETTDYINEMAKTMRTAGYTKPLFYNISQNWNDTPQAQAVCDADVQGLSFQWYPTGLVHNKMLKGNYLINVNHYSIPSEDLTGYKNKTKMVYEFEAADIGGSYMYPAMIRSFREAGMQFATMFAYDPTQIAWSNTEYGTHYLNLLYTPSKAISLMIAARAFHLLPRYKSYGDYPDNDKFGQFKVDYKKDLSEINSDTAFYYSNSTNDNPVDAVSLKHIAGCGNSSIIKYEGTGAYFFDKIDDGIWKLEVYPDALWIRDPFKPTSMSRQVSRLFWNRRNMQVSIPGLGEDFYVKSLSNSGAADLKSVKGSFNIKPGIYLLTSKNSSGSEIKKYSVKEKFLEGLYTPSPEAPAYVVNETNASAFSSGAVKYHFKIASDKKISGAALFVKRAGWRGYQPHPLNYEGGFDFTFVDSSRSMSEGEVQYCVSVNVEGKDYTFPCDIKGSPHDWDFYTENLWNLKLISGGDPVVLMDPGKDISDMIFPPWSRGMRYMINKEFNGEDGSPALTVSITTQKDFSGGFTMQLGVVDRVKLYKDELDNYKFVIAEVKNEDTSEAELGLKFLTVKGIGYGASRKLKKGWQQVIIPVSSLEPSDAAILPSAYPHFLAKTWHAKKNEGEINLSDIDFLQISFKGLNTAENDSAVHTGFEIGRVYLK